MSLYKIGKLALIKNKAKFTLRTYFNANTSTYDVKVIDQLKVDCHIHHLFISNLQKKNIHKKFADE